MAPSTHFESLKYEFSAEELQAIARSLATGNQKLEELENEKKQAVSDFAARIQEERTSISRFARLYSNGYEYRTTECVTRLNDPANGKKTVIRKDTGEVVRTLDMTPEERQEKLPLEPPPEPPEPAPAPEPPQAARPFPQPNAEGGVYPAEEAVIVEQVAGKKGKVTAQLLTLEVAGGWVSGYLVYGQGFRQVLPLKEPVYFSEADAREASAKAVYRYAAGQMKTQTGRETQKAFAAVMDWANMFIADPRSFLDEVAKEAIPPGEEPQP